MATRVIAAPRQRPVAPDIRVRPAASVRPLGLGLQGGGAHGAFTWGVLDRLLEDEHIEIEAISASSAGALNATCLAYGMAIGGAEGARRVMKTFWDRIAAIAGLTRQRVGWFDRVARSWGLEWSPAFIGYDPAARATSPYEFNPLNVNPLREVLEATVDFEELQSPLAPVRLFLSATNVRTGRLKLFRQAELSADAVLASACAPFLFQAIEIEGEYYWDGGYMGSPAILPLIRACDTRDVVLIHTHSPERAELPRTVRQIASRTNEISCNASLMREMRALQFVTELMETGQIAHPGLRPPFWHAIVAEDVLRDHNAGASLHAERELPAWLREQGRTCAATWLDTNFRHLGQQSTIDVWAQYA